MIDIFDRLSPNSFDRSTIFVPNVPNTSCQLGKSTITLLGSQILGDPPRHGRKLLLRLMLSVLEAAGDGVHAASTWC